VTAPAGPPQLSEVVARLSALLGPRSGDVVNLDRGVTKRSCKVTFGGTDYVVALSGPSEELGIDRESERIANKNAGDLGIAPPVATMLHAPHCLVTLFVPGSAVTAEELHGDLLPAVARVLRTLHQSGISLPSAFDPYDVVRGYGDLTRDSDLDVRGYKDCLKLVRGAEKALRKHPEHAPVACHNDLLTDNFIRDGDRLLLADWEYAGMGDPFFDLGNFSANNGLGVSDDERLLDAYFGEPPDARRRAALKLMRIISVFREVMWARVQREISTLDLDFDEYAERHMRRLDEVLEGEDLRAVLKAASAR
jgi:thiamine kinase-like enzyme